MIFPIYTYGQPILRNKAEDIDLDDVLLPSLIKDMFETMHNANGAGLAGPQVGLNRRITVVEEEVTDGKLFKGVFINPKILSYSGRMLVMTEGCLSFPDMYGKVIRPESIEVEWYDENKEYHKEFFHDIESRILQHEIDHLNGILFIDKVSALDRLKMFMRLEDIKNNKVPTSYEIKRN